MSFYTFRRNHFWCHVFECTAESLPWCIFCLIVLDTPAKVTNFSLVVCRYKNIFWFQIAMDQVVFVQKVHTRNNLNEIVKSFVFCISFLFTQQTKKTSLFNELSNEPIIVFILQIPIESHNVLMLQLHMNIDFP